MSFPPEHALSISKQLCQSSDFTDTHSLGKHEHFYSFNFLLCPGNIQISIADLSADLNFGFSFPLLYQLSALMLLLFLYFNHVLIVVQVQLSPFSHPHFLPSHPPPPPTLNLIPFGFVHGSFIDVP